MKSNAGAPLVEYSLASRKNAMVIMAGVVFFSAFSAFAMYKWAVLGVRKPIDIFLGLMFAFVLLERAVPRYTYAAETTVLRVTKRGLFGSTEQEIPYAMMWGVYRYKAKLIGIAKFRRTFRMHSALDPRAVWVIAYKVEKDNAKLENRRVYFKPSEALLERLKEQLPNKVHTAEERIVVDIVKADQ